MKQKIVVFGSFVTDLTSFSQELPVPGQTVLGTRFQMGPGGKGSNQAVAAHRAGADVTMITKVGDDAFGRAALEFYRAEGMDTAHVIVSPDSTTGTANIMVDTDSAQNAIVVVSGACGKITPADMDRCRETIAGADLLLLQLEVNFDALYSAIDAAASAGTRIILNPAPASPIPDEYLRQIDTVTPNEIEAEILTGLPISQLEDVERAAETLLEKGVKNVVITLGSKGVYTTDGDRKLLLPALPVDVVDTTGAGDAFNGGFATALSEGRDLFDAVRFGNAAGALSVTRVGTAPAMPRRAEIDTLYRAHYEQRQER